MILVYIVYNTPEIFYYKSGSRYEGDWRNGNKEGKGIYYYIDGDRYEGDWRNDNMEGNGIYYRISCCYSRYVQFPHIFYF